MKKLVLLFVFLLLIRIAIAQLDIRIIHYDSESENSRIQIHNMGDKNYEGLTIAIDDGEPQTLVGLLKKNSAIVTLRIVPPGEHKVTIMTDKGDIFSKTLNFAKSGETIKKELEQEREERVVKEEELKKIPSVPPSMPTPQEKLPYQKKLFIILIVSVSAILFLILLVVLILKYKKSEKAKEKQKPTQRPFYIKPVVRQLTPSQRKMQIELIKKKEKEKERKRRELIESLRRKK